MHKSLLSVVVPVYNVEKYLAECINSILNQTFKDLEIILVDDGSTDGSGKICDNYASKYPDKIKTIHKSNGGPSSARNIGIDVAVGKYITFVDSDDALLPNMYQELMPFFKDEEIGVVVSQFLCWDLSMQDNFNLQGKISNIDLLEAILDWNCTPSVCNKIFKREYLGSLRFPLNLRNEEIPILSRLLLKPSYAYVSQSGYYKYRIHSSGFTRNLRPNFFDIFINVDMIRGMLENEGVSSRLKEAFMRYELSLHIMSGVRIISYKKKKEYRDWLRKNRKYIITHLPTLLFGRKMSMRWRLKAIYALIF